ncbi:transcription termination/antitermination protein NusG [Kitasatospora purpeofusca]|uniref:hypothetical protein n=1 Tax=Kitasatospora purpeofusca TaxID=67352 RepID=UPI003696AC10
MDEIRIQCESARGDYILAARDGRKIAFNAYRAGEYQVNAFVSPSAVRDHARRLIALADAIDGGGSSAGVPIHVGDRVRVVEDDDCNRAGDFVGRVGTVKEVRDASSRLPCTVTFGAGDHGARDGWWRCARVERADEESIQAAPSRSYLILRAKELLPAAASADDLIKLADYLAG